MQEKRDLNGKLIEGTYPKLAPSITRLVHSDASVAVPDSRPFCVKCGTERANMGDKCAGCYLADGERSP